MTLPEIDVWVPAEDGTFISEKHARIAEMVSDYDPALRLAWIPPGRRSDPRDKPFAVIETRNGRDYIVFYADECDERIIARLFENDSSRHDVQKRMEAHNAAIKAYQMKVYMDSMQERHEMAHSILRSPKSSYTVKDPVTGETRKFTE